MVPKSVPIIHLVDEAYPRDPELICLAPDSLRLRLHPSHGIENHHPAVQHPEGALHLGRRSSGVSMMLIRSRASSR